MDIRTSGWFGSVKMAGAKQPVIFEGSVMNIANQVLKHLQEASLRRDSTGNRTITITIQDNEFGREANHGLDADFLSGLDMSLVDQATDEDLARLYSPWAEDSDWKRFLRFQSSAHNYSLALPGEIQELMTRLKAKYGGTKWANPMTQAVESFDDKLIDKRARQ